jgi:hypothetical protein
MSPLTTKAQILKFESNILRSTARRYKKSRKTQEGHLEEGKPQKPTKGTKSGKAKKNGKKEQRKSQNQHRNSKEQENVKISTKSQNQHSIWNQLP